MQLFIIGIILLSIAFSAIGIKLFFDKNAKVPAGRCKNKGQDASESCTCGNSGNCHNI